MQYTVNIYEMQSSDQSVLCTVFAQFNAFNIFPAAI